MLIRRDRAHQVIPRHARSFQRQHHIVQDREVKKEIRDLKGTTYSQSSALVSGKFSDIFTEDEYPAARRRQHPAEQLKKSSLARSVGTDNRQSLSRLNAKGDLIYCTNASKVLSKIFYCKRLQLSLTYLIV